MNLWNLLTLIAFTAAISGGWLTGKSAGAVGALAGLLIGAIAGVGSVVGMYCAGLRFEKWVNPKELTIKIGILCLFIDLLGLAWCFFICGIVGLCTRLLIRYISAL